MDDLDRLRDRLRRLPDDRLARMIGPERRLYSSEALVVAEVEAESRDLVPAPDGDPDRPARRAFGPVDGEIEDAFDAGWDRLVERVRGGLPRRRGEGDGPAARPPVPRPAQEPERYPLLRAVGVTCRVASVVLGVLAVGAAGLGVAGLVTGAPGALFVAVQSALVLSLSAVVLLGGAEAVGLGIDVEGHLRAIRRSLPPPADPAAPPADEG